MYIKNPGKVLFHLLLLILLTTLSGYLSYSQTLSNDAQTHKWITRHRFYPNAPTSMGEISAENKIVGFQTPFDPRQPDWLRTLSFKVRNVTDKKIVYLRVYINFPETQGKGSTGNMLIYQMDLGQADDYIRSLGKIMTMGLKNPPLQLLPNNDVLVSFYSKYDQIAKFVNTAQPIETINTVLIGVEEVYFDDGVKWSGGDYTKLDPANPSQRIKVDPPQLAQYRGSF